MHEQSKARPRFWWVGYLIFGTGALLVLWVVGGLVWQSFDQRLTACSKAQDDHAWLAVEEVQARREGWLNTAEQQSLTQRRATAVATFEANACEARLGQRLGS